MPLPTPYYDDGTCTIYHGDCLELLPDIDADVIVTDPPYGQAYVSGQGRERSAPISGDTDTRQRDAVLAWWGDRPAVVFGTWKKARPDGVRQVLIWHKAGTGYPGGDLAVPWANTHEEVYVIGGPWDAPRSGSVLSIKGLCAGDADRPDHPTPKPVPLMAELIAKCPPGVILDPFMGSGSTLRAAKDLGRRAIGIEVEERYCEIAAKRLGQGVLDLGAVS